MKAQLTTYQQLFINHKYKNAGFTIIELLVVIMILGILAAISTNSLLNHIPKAKQSEAKTNIASINSAQSTYWLTKSSFANSMTALAIGLPASTSNYTYNIAGTATLGTVSATSTNTALKGYSGAVQQALNANNQNQITSVICEAVAAGGNIALPTSGQPGTNACGANIELGQ